MRAIFINYAYLMNIYSMSFAVYVIEYCTNTMECINQCRCELRWVNVPIKLCHYYERGFQWISLQNLTNDSLKYIPEEITIRVWFNLNWCQEPSKDSSKRGGMLKREIKKLMHVKNSVRKVKLEIYCYVFICRAHCKRYRAKVPYSGSPKKGP